MKEKQRNPTKDLSIGLENKQKQEKQQAQERTKEIEQMKNQSQIINQIEGFTVKVIFSNTELCLENLIEAYIKERLCIY